MLDTARVYPPRPPSRSFTAILFKPGLSTITEYSFLLPDYQKSAIPLLGTDKITKCPVPILEDVLMVNQDDEQEMKKEKFNMMASRLLGRPVYGPAVLIPAG